MFYLLRLALYYFKCYNFDIAYMMKGAEKRKKYVCEVCGWVYDEEAGIPEEGIAPGTKFEDLPEDFVCPLCGVGKDQFAEE